MNISNARPKVDKVRAIAVKKTAEVFGFTESYIRQIIRGDVEHEEVSRSFNKTYKAIQNAVNA